VRFFDEEGRWEPATSRYPGLFKGTIRTCVNDSIPTWHREDSSLMCLPYIVPTFLGLRSTHGLRILQDVMEGDDPKALVMGGAKLHRVADLMEIAGKGVEIFTSGLPGQLIARSRGYDLGEVNNRYLAHRFSSEEFAGARELASLHGPGSRLAVQHPTDFVEEDGVQRNVELGDLTATGVR
jgi:phosphoglycerate kinase